MTYKKSSNSKKNIINVAKKLFYINGYKGTTIRQIQKEAKHASIHYYYSNKEEIITEIFEEYFLKIINNPLVEKLTALEQLVYLFITHFIMLQRNEKFKNIYLEVIEFFDSKNINYIYPLFLKIIADYSKEEFNESYLKLCLSTLLATQKELLKQYNQSTEILPKEIREYFIMLIHKLLYISEEDTDKAYKNALRHASEVDYEKLNVFLS